MSSQRDVLDVESLAGHLLRVGSVFRFLAEHRGSLFPDSLFADCSRLVGAGHRSRAR